jgi:hypothetical protein
MFGNVVRVKTPPPWLGQLLLIVLLGLLTMQAVEVCLNFIIAIRYPFELDYGEGIVWQQAELIPGPRMYSTSTALPFIVFHYPPLYYLVVRATLAIQSDFLAAGRLVSALMTIPIVLSISGIVLVATRRRNEARATTDYFIALAAGFLALNMHAVQSWAMLMRVDMLAVALGITGVLIGAWAEGRFWGTLLALLVCSAAVFAKQTELPAGVAVFFAALLRNPRAALGAAAIAGCTCLAMLAFLQTYTSGGFLLNIVVYNLNPWKFRHVYWVLWSERYALGITLLIILAVRLVGRSIQSKLPGQFCRSILLLDFAVTTLMLVAIFKSGSSYNYLLDWEIVGCALVGVMLVDLSNSSSQSGWVYPLALTLISASVVVQPVPRLARGLGPDQLATQAAVVRRIAAATKPVASENMTLVMRAGKQVPFEPAIVTSLAQSGVWNEEPLLQMIRSRGFAFILTLDNDHGGGAFRTPAVDAAMREAYPQVEHVGHDEWLHLPRD